MRTTLLLAICLVTIPCVEIANAEFQIGGYYKNFFTIFDSPLENEPVTGAVVNRCRLNLSYAFAAPISFALSYDFAPRVQDPSLFSESPIAVSIPPHQYRVVDLESRFYPNENDPTGSVGIYHNLDRAFVEFSTDFADISVGRDAIAWGSARVVNPTDVLTPFTYDQLDTEDRIGVDAVRVRVPIGAMGEWDTGYIFGEGFKFEKSAFYLRSQLNAAETDFSVSLVGFQKHLLAGLDMARGIGGAGFWLEVAYVFVESFARDADTESNYLRASTGLDYSFGEKTYGFIEYHYNGAGAKAPENYIANLDQPAYTQGSVYLMGIHYLAPGFSYQLTPLISSSGQMLFNLSDLSIWVGPQVEYNIAEDIYLSAGGFLNIGKRLENKKTPEFQSEFGSYPNVIFTSFRAYF
ncbi:MAG: hypothetical protein OXN17_21235 [Candidatus Poribacteria bacterium]|nr:hypothetical protein [Candidatus Poribacteria bacterium]